MFDLLSDGWISAWRKEIVDAGISSEDWNVVLRFDDDRDDAPLRGVFLRFEGGALRESRLASAADAEAAQFVIGGAAKAWKHVLEGKSDPVVALMMGRLDLRKGSLGRLAPHVKVAKQLLHAATRVPTRFPEDMA